MITYHAQISIQNPRALSDDGCSIVKLTLESLKKILSTLPTAPMIFHDDLYQRDFRVLCTYGFFDGYSTVPIDVEMEGDPDDQRYNPFRITPPMSKAAFCEASSAIGLRAMCAWDYPEPPVRLTWETDREATNRWLVACETDDEARYNQEKYLYA